MGLIPPWVYAAAAGAVLVTGFGAGWKVRSWQCEAATAAALKQGVKDTKVQQDVVHVAASQQAQETQDATQATQVRQVGIRTIYKNVAVPGDCEPPATALRVLDGGVEAASARAGGQPGPVVPSRTTKTNPLR